MRPKIVLFLFVLIFGCKEKFDTPEKIIINSSWQFKMVGDSVWIPAEVPGNVISDLLENEVITDPFIGDNEKNVQWVFEKDWVYKTQFSCSEALLDKQQIELTFEGLDTYAEVFLNDSLILNTNNAFRSYSIPVKPLLKSKNDLKIVFENTGIHEERAKAKLPYALPEGNRIFTRKAQFQYGWDWGPKLNTSGIWRPVSLLGWNDAKIRDVYIQQNTLESNEAKLKAHVAVAAEHLENKYLDILVNDTINSTHQLNTTGSYEFTINNPKLWWPHNLGDPYQYELKFILRYKKTILDTLKLKKGLRSIDLVTEKDSLGESFYFKVNDVPVYVKGANYIPQNSLQNKVKKEDYNQLLEDVVDANMNMLRVWGGGIYENSIFYDLCDEKGILIWQDFMFACAMYPGDEEFLTNVRLEAEYNVKRLRNHASIALWCGNNENSEGWHRWGWQANRSDEEKVEIWKNYLKVFDSILPNTVANLTDTDYWESSPKYGRGNPKYKFEGDAHDWWIWHDGYPFEHLEKNVPRFMSEFGFQSFPSKETISYMNQLDTLDISTNGFKNHQKHSRGFQIIEAYMQRDFPLSKNPEDYIYLSQLLQAYGIGKGIEAHRRARPYNMGTLYWQLNDCWPAVSWSSIDFLGNWKALHYKAKRSFKNILISSELSEDNLSTFIVNDELRDDQGMLTLTIQDFYGKIIHEESKEVTAQAGTSRRVHSLDLKELKINPNKHMVVASFNSETSIFYLAKPKDLILPTATIVQKIVKVDNGFEIHLKSNVFQKDVFLSTNVHGKFSDNFFDLLPNEAKIVHFKSKSTQIDALKIKTFNNLIR